MGDFNLVIWKVEHGSAAFLSTPNGRTIMFDAGSSDDFSPAMYLHKNFGMDSYANRLWKLVISHPDRDHITDLPNIIKLIRPIIFHRNDKIPSDIVFPSGTSNLQEPLASYKYMLDNYNRKLKAEEQNEPIANWGNVFVKCFSCSKDKLTGVPDSKIKNNMSLVAYVRYRDTEIIFPGDLEPVGWQVIFEETEFLEYAGSAKYRILIAPHHGRESGICFESDGKKVVYQRILNELNPDIVIMSDKWGNETTVPEKYRPHMIGFPVFNGSNPEPEIKKVITTKTNNFVHVRIDSINESIPVIRVP